MQISLYYKNAHLLILLTISGRWFMGGSVSPLIKYNSLTLALHINLLIKISRTSQETFNTTTGLKMCKLWNCILQILPYRHNLEVTGIMLQTGMNQLGNGSPQDFLTSGRCVSIASFTLVRIQLARCSPRKAILAPRNAISRGIDMVIFPRETLTTLPRFCPPPAAIVSTILQLGNDVTTSLRKSTPNSLHSPL